MFKMITPTNKRGGIIDMAWTPKPNNRAFIVDASKANAFLNDKRPGAKTTLDRYYAHHPELTKKSKKEESR